MSAATDIPGGGGTPDAGTQGAAPAGTPAATDASSSGYIGKIRSDPDFAEREALAHQSRADKAEATLNQTNKWLGEQLHSRYGGEYTGDQIVQFLDQYSNALQNPQLGEMIRNFHATGEVQGMAAASDTTSNGEEYKTPEEIKIEALERQLNSAEQRIGQAELGSGQQVLQQHLGEIRKELDIEPDVWARVEKKMAKQIVQWNSSAAGQQSIRGLGGQDGYTTVRALVYADLSPDEIAKGVNNAALRKSNQLGGLSTGGPSGSASMGNEPPPVFDTAKDAFDWAKAHPGGHDSS